MLRASTAHITYDVSAFLFIFPSTTLIRIFLQSRAVSYFSSSSSTFPSFLHTHTVNTHEDFTMAPRVIVVGGGCK